MVQSKAAQKQYIKWGNKLLLLIKGSQYIKISPSKFLRDFQLYQLNIVELTNHPKTHWLKTRATFIVHNSAGQVESLILLRILIGLSPASLVSSRSLGWLCRSSGLSPISGTLGPSALCGVLFSKRLAQACSHRQKYRREKGCVQSLLNHRLGTDTSHPKHVTRSGDSRVGNRFHLLLGGARCRVTLSELWLQRGE